MKKYLSIIGVILFLVFVNYVSFTLGNQRMKIISDFPTGSTVLIVERNQRAVVKGFSRGFVVVSVDGYKWEYVQPQFLQKVK